MNNDLLLVFGFALIVLLVFVMPIAIYAIRGEHLKAMAEHGDGQAGERVAELSAELDAVNQRVAVLERIVTDGSFDLKQELKRVQAQRKVAAKGGKAPAAHAAKKPVVAAAVEAEREKVKKLKAQVAELKAEAKSMDNVL